MEKITIEPRLEQVKLVVIGEASSLQAVLQNNGYLLEWKIIIRIEIRRVLKC